MVACAVHPGIIGTGLGGVIKTWDGVEINIDALEDSRDFAWLSRDDPTKMQSEMKNLKHFLLGQHGLVWAKKGSRGWCLNFQHPRSVFEILCCMKLNVFLARLQTFSLDSDARDENGHGRMEDILRSMEKRYNGRLVFWNQPCAWPWPKLQVQLLSFPPPTIEIQKHRLQGNSEPCFSHDCDEAEIVGWHRCYTTAWQWQCSCETIDLWEVLKCNLI